MVLAIAGIVASAMGLLLMRQQRFYRGTGEEIATRQSVRDAIEVLTTDIRGMSVADTARLLADSAIEFFSTIGTSVVCQRLSDTEIGLTSAISLTSFATQPDTGDLAIFYTDSTRLGPPSPGWERARIGAFGRRSAATTCAPGSAFSNDAQVSRPGAAFVSLQAPLSSGVKPGSPVKFVRRNRYSLYRAADGGWYLGYRRCNALGTSICGAVQPLSGPYRAYSRDTNQSGIAFHYFDRGGRILGSVLSLARVDIVARGASRQQIIVEGRHWTPSDSARVSVAIRNRIE